MFAVIRIRGTVNRKREIKDTLKFLRLNAPNHCVIIPETRKYLGMLKKAKDYITWGKIDKKTLAKLLENRLKIIGDKLLDLKELKEITDFNDFNEFSEALIKGKVKLNDYKKMKPVFRLNPPKKGYRSTRLNYPKGDLGNRGDKINELIERMI